MNARIRLTGKVSKKQQEVARKLVKEQFRNESEGHTRRLLKIVCIALNEKFLFGADRLSRFLDEVMTISDQHLTDEAFWVHADKRLKQMNVPFSCEDYDKLEA